MALDRVLPPTIGVETLSPRANFSESPFHVSTRPRPWFKSETDQPRRAGVSAFGFGGTNFHAVLEAYEGDPTPPSPTASATSAWSATTPRVPAPTAEIHRQAPT